MLLDIALVLFRLYLVVGLVKAILFLLELRKKKNRYLLVEMPEGIVAALMCGTILALTFF